MTENAHDKVRAVNALNAGARTSQALALNTNVLYDVIVLSLPVWIKVEAKEKNPPGIHCVLPVFMFH